MLSPDQPLMLSGLSFFVADSFSSGLFSKSFRLVSVGVIVTFYCFNLVGAGATSIMMKCAVTLLLTSSCITSSSAPDSPNKAGKWDNPDAGSRLQS